MGFNTPWYIQKATYWEISEPDAYGGHEFLAPEIINCRLEHKVSEVVNSIGELIVSNSVLWCDKKLIEGSYIILGSNVELNPTNAVSQGRSAQIIKAISEIYSIDGKSVELRYHM